MRKLFYLFIAALFFNSTSGVIAQTESTTARGEIPEIQISEFEQKASDLVGEKISVKGTVVHVCKHGGKRMFLIGEDPNTRVKITKGSNITAFKPEMEGSDAVAQGVVNVKTVDEAYLDQWEQEVKANIKESKKKIHTGEEGHEEKEGDQEETLNKIKNMRKQLKESNNDVLSFYSIESNEFKILK